MNASPDRRDDWYRRKYWSPAIERAFRERLARSRLTFHKAQYLRIQGATLIERSDPRCVRAGLALCREVIESFPDERSQHAACWNHMADAHRALGQRPEELACLRRGVECEKVYPNVTAGNALALATYLARFGVFADAAEIEASLASDSHLGERLLPLARFRIEFVRAVLADWRGDIPAAATHARQAFHAAGRRKSWMPRHASLGLVRNVPADMKSRLFDILRRAATS